MTKDRIVAALVRIYPAAWRREYGAELTAILLERPLGPGVIADVAWHGVWQRGRAAEPSTVLGLTAILVMLTGIGMTDGSYGGGDWPALVHWRAFVQPTSKTFPDVTVTFMTSEFYLLLLAGCGCWTYLRHGGKVTHCGVAGMRMSLIAAIPIVLVSLLMMSGFLDMAFLDARGAATLRPHPWALLIAPVFRMPEAWLWGSIGGLLGRCVARRRRALTQAGLSG